MQICKSNTKLTHYQTFFIMEKIVRILEQTALQQRTYTDKAGQQQVFNSMGFVLTDGLDTFYAEAVGDKALRMPVFDKQYGYRVLCEMRHATFTAADGSLRHRNDVYLNGIAVV